ncbi:MAG: hypothetical protein ACREIA_10465 [Opitutaceae bacterium]
MKSPDSELSKLLRSWQIESQDDPALASKVWRRIEASEPPGRARARWIDELVALFARPLVAVSMVACFTATGAILAFAQHKHHDGARFDRLVSEYVRSIDPILLASTMPGDGDRRTHP